MSAALVEFQTLDNEPCPPDQKPARFAFRCVNRNRDRDPRLETSLCDGLLIAEGPHSFAHGIKRDGQGKNGGRPQWGWDGNWDAPTFTPSVNCEKHCGWHGYIRKGRCVDTNGKDEP